MESATANQLISQLERHAAALTLDQRLRLARCWPAPYLTRSLPGALIQAPPLLLTVDAAAEQLNIGRPAVYDLIRPPRQHHHRHLPAHPIHRPHRLPRPAQRHLAWQH